MSKNGPSEVTRHGHVSQALVFASLAEGLTLSEVTVSSPVEGEVLIKVAACGACHSDVHKLEGHGAVEPPCIIGHEISGEVVELGAGVADLKIGQKVVCSFLLPCGHCVDCRAGREDDCVVFRQRMQADGTRFDGSARFFDGKGQPLKASGVGGLSRLVALPQTGVFPLPETWPASISLADASVLGCAGLTAYGAVRRGAELRDGQTVAVIAAGGVGLCVVALARYFGAQKIIVLDLKDDALDVATSFGADHVVRSDLEDGPEAVRRFTGGRGVDVVFDTIGLPVTIASGLAMAAMAGKVVITGLAGAGDQAVVPDLNAFVRRKLKLVGSYAAVPSVDMPALLTAVADGAIDPARLISARFMFADAESAFDAVARGRVSGRALIEYS